MREESGGPSEQHGERAESQTPPALLTAQTGKLHTPVDGTQEREDDGTIGDLHMLDRVQQSEGAVERRLVCPCHICQSSLHTQSRGDEGLTLRGDGGFTSQSDGSNRCSDVRQQSSPTKYEGGSRDFLVQSLGDAGLSSASAQVPESEKSSYGEVHATHKVFGDATAVTVGGGFHAERRRSRVGPAASNHLGKVSRGSSDLPKDISAPSTAMYARNLFHGS